MSVDGEPKFEHSAVKGEGMKRTILFCATVLLPAGLGGCAAVHATLADQFTPTSEPAVSVSPAAQVPDQVSESATPVVADDAISAPASATPLPAPAQGKGRRLYWFLGSR